MRKKIKILKRMNDCPILDNANYYSPFPPPGQALANGLLCRGGDLAPQLLIFAYSRGVFPWYSKGEPLYWWTPDPRMVLYPHKFHLSSRSLRKLKKNPFTLTLNAAFEKVIGHCADLRSDGTWITEEMKEAYILLNELGFCHSIEAWKEGRLAGGLYGVAIGGVFFGESMFYLETEASRACLQGLVNILKLNNFALIDCQQETEHMKKAGAEPIGRKLFLKLLYENVYCGDMEKILTLKSPLQGKLTYYPESCEWR